MKKIANFIYTSITVVMLSGFCAFYGAISQGATVTPFGPMVSNEDLWMPPLGAGEDSLFVPEAIVCKWKHDADAVAEAFERYGTIERFSVAYDTYRKHVIRCEKKSHYWLPTSSLNAELLASHQGDKAFVVKNTTFDVMNGALIIDYVVLARPEVLDVVFRTCAIEWSVPGTKYDAIKTGQCWRDL